MSVNNVATELLFWALLETEYRYDYRYETLS
jgi:hypothetical protein